MRDRKLVLNWIVRHDEVNCAGADYRRAPARYQRCTDSIPAKIERLKGNNGEQRGQPFVVIGFPNNCVRSVCNYFPGLLSCTAPQMSAMATPGRHS